MLSNWPNKYDEIVRVRALLPAKEGAGGCVPPLLSKGVGAVLGQSAQHSRTGGGGVLGQSAQHSAAAVR
jgi:hypothetical protein